MLIVFALCPVPLSCGLSLPLIGSFAEPAMNEYPALLMSPPPPPHEFRFRWKGRRRNFSRNSEPVAFHSEPSSSSAPLRPLKSQDCNILEYAKCSSRAPGAGGRGRVRRLHTVLKQVSLALRGPTTEALPSHSASLRPCRRRPARSGQYRTKTALSVKLPSPRRQIHATSDMARVPPRRRVKMGRVGRPPARLACLMSP